MTKISTNQFKNGVKIIINNAPCVIIENEFHKPGKGQAVMRIKYRNLLNQRVVDKTFKSGESVEEADVLTKEMTYLYKDQESWCFMDPDSYEQINIKEDLVGDAKNWLIGQESCQVITWNSSVISIDPPDFVELKILETEPGLKGDTVSGATKPAILETGQEIQVPLFVEIGELVKIDTRSGDYVSRV